MSQKRQKIDESSNNRKSAQVTRTLMACELCRRQKTRCFRDPDSTSCLRCIFLKKPCSFERDLDLPGSLAPVPHLSGTITTSSNTADSIKLDQIQRSISEVLTILKQGEMNDSYAKSNSTKDNVSINVPTLTESRHYQDDPLSFQTPTNSFETSVFSIVANQIPQKNIPKPVLELIGISTPGSPRNFKQTPNDVISAGILSETDAIDLMNDFRRNYGRWILFPLNMSSSVLIERIRYKSSLLLTTCYCLALRYSLSGIVDSELLLAKKTTHKLLMKHLVKDMSSSFLKYSCFNGGAADGHIEFLQALALLSIYSLSLSSMAHHAFEGDVDLFTDQDINLDPWLLSGFGLNLFVTKSTFGSLLKHDNTLQSPFTIFYDELDSEEFQTLAVLRTYNHLTLVHLINCIFSGRMCVIDEFRLNFCTATLSLPSSTNFDGRMVSEIGILLIGYKYIQKSLNSNIGTVKESKELFDVACKEVDTWYEQWNYLFSQPAPQFVELCYHFCYLMIHFVYIYQRTTLSTKRDINAPSDLFREDNVAFIIQHSDKISFTNMHIHALSIVRFINVIESDSYFAYLLDQIHFCFFFAGIVLVRIVQESTEDERKRKLIQQESHETEQDMRVLIQKFEMMCSFTNSPDDITSRYCKGLEECFQSVFQTK